MLIIDGDGDDDGDQDDNDDDDGGGEDGDSMDRRREREVEKRCFCVVLCVLQCQDTHTTPHRTTHTLPLVLQFLSNGEGEQRECCLMAQTHTHACTKF